MTLFIVPSNPSLIFQPNIVMIKSVNFVDCLQNTQTRERILSQHENEIEHRFGVLFPKKIPPPIRQAGIVKVLIHRLRRLLHQKANIMKGVPILQPTQQIEILKHMKNTAL
jgi:hypothetical protein